MSTKMVSRTLILYRIKGNGLGKITLVRKSRGKTSTPVTPYYIYNTVYYVY